MTHTAAVGTHVLADFYGVADSVLRDAAALDAILRQAAETAGAQVLSSHFHSFGDLAGVTGVVLLAESHVSVHTWPELGFAALDIFMCGRADPAIALSVLAARLAPNEKRCSVVERRGAMRHVDVEAATLARAARQCNDNGTLKQ